MLIYLTGIDLPSAKLVPLKNSICQGKLQYKFDKELDFYNVCAHNIELNLMLSRDIILCNCYSCVIHGWEANNFVLSVV